MGRAEEGGMIMGGMWGELRAAHRYVFLVLRYPAEMRWVGAEVDVGRQVVG